MLLSAADCSQSENVEGQSAGAACPNLEGRLNVRLSGSLRRDITWSGMTLRCSGMPRPDEIGVRLRFRSSDPEDPLIVLIGFEPAEDGEEIPANVTIMVEGQGLFFSNQQRENCWVRLRGRSALSKLAGVEQISGLVWCINALPQVNGTGTVGISDLDFVGFVPWPNDET